MKKKLFLLSVLFILILSTFSCGDDYDDFPQSSSVNDFIWKGLNQYYYWLQDSPDLADNRFSTNSEYQTFLNSYSPPENLFEHLLVDRQTDRFSVIYSDYTALEQALSGTQKNNGVDYELRYKNGSSTEIFGWVRYILPGSDAALKSIQRGDFFYAVNGTSLTVDNYRNLLANDTYTLNLADYDSGNITPNGNTVTLTKTAFSENPVHIKKTFTVGTKKIGYLMYNGFYSQYESELNDAFVYFASENVTHLILDLRYNSGGSVNTATRLASMITGQFGTDIFAKQQWNNKLQSILDPEDLLNRFTSTLGNGSSLQNLNLDKLYVLTSKRTASASELVINGLESHINVTQIGDATTGKNVGSITLYDSPNFRKENVNPNHKYAMQPIVLKIANKNNFSDYVNGLQPDVNQIEDLANLGMLGETSDPLLNTALNYIDTNGKLAIPEPQHNFRHFEDSKSIVPFGNEMYLETIPDFNIN
ncbi:peptidase S41 [Flavobacterium jejuense]|uniref:Peptidase S41 n=1 Tax=Flavobacterium jejuense TaxID=1544455 RepID=A0ABX0IV14_9FLAO|nr:S41 family peptidase [Flavobacterium jejuense]NHN27749.1 peptidase S41 [Flavobacterium jejuense]